MSIHHNHKTIKVINAATGDASMVTIDPKTRGREVLQTLGLPQEYQLVRPNGYNVIDSDKDVFDLVDPYDATLYTSTATVVGVMSWVR